MLTVRLARRKEDVKRAVLSANALSTAARGRTLELPGTIAGAHVQRADADLSGTVAAGDDDLVPGGFSPLPLKA